MTGRHDLAPAATVDAAGLERRSVVVPPGVLLDDQAGDVDGDRRDDVMARGPFGIRTWFYNRRGTGGWERYLADGYPAFPTSGQTNAFAALTAVAKDNNSIHRERPTSAPCGMPRTRHSHRISPT